MTFAPFNAIDSFVPEALGADLSWRGHLPFAGFLIALTRPRTIVDVGLAQGDSILTFAEAVRRSRLRNSSIIGIKPVADDDLDWRHDEVHRNIMTRVSSYAPNVEISGARIDKAADQIPDDSIDLLHLDGMGSVTALRDALTLFMPKLSGRGILMIHDIARFDDSAGFWRIWRDMSAQHPHITFGHASGLGALAPGRANPSLYKLVFDLSLEERIALAKLFSKLGKAALLEHCPPDQLKRALGPGKCSLPGDMDLTDDFARVLKAARW